MLLRAHFFLALAITTVSAQAQNFSLLFDGIDDRLQVAQFPSITGPFTVEAWIKPGDQGGGIQPRVLELVGTADTTFRLGLAQVSQNFPDPTQRNVLFELHSQPNGRQDVFAGFALQPQTWHHLAAVFDGSEQILYVNGERVDSLLASGPLKPNSVLDIGTGVRLTGDNDTFDGLIDEVRIWSTGRSEDEINSTMFTSTQGDEPGLLAYFDFNEGTGQTATDRTGNGNDAILGENNNAPTWFAEGAPILPPGVSGRVTGFQIQRASCLNQTTGQRIVLDIQEPITLWDCAAAGLETAPGDKIKIDLRGEAD